MQHVVCHLRPALTSGAPAAYSGDVAEYDAVPADDGRSIAPDAAPVCQWCCHHFVDEPVGVPTRFSPVSGFTTVGQYCSHPCAAASIFDEHSDSNAAWTRYQLLNDMAGGREPVQRAPPRRALSMFGGTMSVDAFRARSESGSAMTVVERQAPVIVEHVRLEEIPSHYLYRDVYRPLDEERVSQYKVKLERAKPRKSSFFGAA